MTDITLTINGMTCGHCVERVTTALTAVPGVDVVSVRVGRAAVRYDPARVSPAQLTAAVEAAGYRGHVAEAAPGAETGPDEHRDHHHREGGHEVHRDGGRALTSLAVSATAHCLTGCAIGEVLGMVIGTAAGWSTLTTVALSVVLAFLFGYALTLKPLLGAGLPFAAAMGLAFASDTLSITTMEIVDNLVMLAIPGAMDAGIGTPLFWGSLALSLALAFLAALPVNRWLLSQGKGHALVHQHHHG